MTATTTTPHLTGQDTDDKPVVHAVCKGCYPIPGPGDVGMCGAKPTRPAVNPAPPADRPLCVVCEELAPKPCECGVGG